MMTPRPSQLYSGFAGHGIVYSSDDPCGHHAGGEGFMRVGRASCGWGGLHAGSLPDTFFLKEVTKRKYGEKTKPSVPQRSKRLW